MPGPYCCIRLTTRAWKNRLYRLPPKKDYHVFIARSFLSLRIRTTESIEEEIKKRKEDKGKKKQESEKGKERKEKTRKARKDKTRRGSKGRKIIQHHVCDTYAGQSYRFILLLYPYGFSRMLYICGVSTAVVPSRALSSCCAVARAQHLGQHNRFAHQSPRG